MLEATLKDHGSSHARCSENVARIAAQERLSEHTEALKDLLGRPWAQLHVTLAAASNIWTMLLEKNHFKISMPPLQ